MTMMVQATTDQAPELLDLIEHRRANGLDTFDEWWEGVYRVVTGPSPEHSELGTEPVLKMHPAVVKRGLKVAGPINIGVDKEDAKVPDYAIYRPDTPRTSPAFLTTAEMVIEILSPGERPGEKLPFYAAWHVKEYLEVDLPRGAVRLLANREGAWEAVDHSDVIDLAVADVVALI